jgi:hypothetical protein
VNCKIFSAEALLEVWLIKNLAVRIGKGRVEAFSLDTADVILGKRRAEKRRRTPTIDGGLF